jgi:hypothetical protein
MASIEAELFCKLVGTRDLQTLWGAPVGPVRAAQAGLARPSCPVHPCLAHWAHRLAPNCITHPHWMYKRSWHLARPPVAVALAAIRECLWRTHRQTNTMFVMCKRRPRRCKVPLPLTANATQRASPFPSWATERKERDDQARVPGPVSTTAPGNTRALFRSTRGKELGLWPGTRVFVGRPGFVTAPV